MYKYDDLLGTQVSAPIVPASLEDTYPTHDSTYGKGGYKEVATIEDRNNIPEERLKEGTLVYVQDTKKTYKYLGNRQWREVEALENDVDLSKFALKSDLDALATVAKTGDYNDLINKPTFNEFATKSELSNKQDKLPDGVNGQVLKWNNGWKPGTDETGTAAETEINKLRLTHEGDNIQLKYNGIELSSVPDNNSGGGEAGDITSQITSKLDITHDSNERLHLTWNGNMIGSGTEDLKGEGGGHTPITAGSLYFDNPMMGMPVNESGNNSEFYQTSRAFIYEGPLEKEISSLTFTGAKLGETTIQLPYVTTNNNIVTINIPENRLQGIIGRTYVLNFVARFTEDGEEQTREGSIQLVGLNTGTDGVGYNLSTGIAAIRKGVGTQSSVLVPEKFNPQLVASKGSSTIEVYKANALPDKFEITCVVDDTTTLSVNSDGSYDIPFVIQKHLLVKLSYDNLVIDSQDIPVVFDGVEGISATLYNITPLGTSLKQYKNDDETSGTKGTILIKATKSRGGSTMSFVGNSSLQTGKLEGRFQNDTDTYGAKITVELDNNIDNDAQFEWSANQIKITIDKRVRYNIALVSLFEGDSRVSSIIVPITQLAEAGEGVQSLEKSILVEHPISNYNTSEYFYDGTTAVDGVLIQEFVKYADPSDVVDNWGVYLCVKQGNRIPADIPESVTSTDTGAHFQKMSYTFGEYVTYLVAEIANITSLTSKQIVVVDKNNNVVAGMASGDKIPTVDNNGKITDIDAPNNRVRIWAGTTSGNIAAAPFKVEQDGTLTATKASIRGNVSATLFEVVDKDNPNNKQMWMTTWGKLKEDYSDLEVSGLDSTTLSTLNSNPSTPVIAMKYGSNIYLLTPFLLRNITPQKSRIDEQFYDITQTATLLPLTTTVLYKDPEDDCYYTSREGTNKVSGITYYKNLGSYGYTGLFMSTGNSVGNPYGINNVIPLNSNFIILEEFTFSNGKINSTNNLLIAGRKRTITYHEENNSPYYTESIESGNNWYFFTIGHQDVRATQQSLLESTIFVPRENRYIPLSLSGNTLEGTTDDLRWSIYYISDTGNAGNSKFQKQNGPGYVTFSGNTYTYHPNI